MNISTSTADFEPANASSPVIKTNRQSGGALLGDSQNSSSTLYNSALDNITDNVSQFDASSNNNNYSKNDSYTRTLLDAGLNSNVLIPNETTTNTGKFDSLEATFVGNNVNTSFIESEGSRTPNNSSLSLSPILQKIQDAKSILLADDIAEFSSIIDISDDSTTGSDDSVPDDSVHIVISSEDESDSQNAKVIDSETNINASIPRNMHVGNANNTIHSTTFRASKSPDVTDFDIAEKRRRKPESLIQSSKQKLNVAIAEASAAESRDSDFSVGDSDKNALASDHPSTKRDIKIYDNIEEFEQNMPSTVTVLDTPFGSKVYLVGTAHFSEESQDDVSYVIRNVRPDIVMVELCPSRVHILKLDEKTLLEETKNLNMAKIRTILQTHGLANGFFFLLLLHMNAQIAKELGMAPGGEFRRAFEEIHKLPNCALHLGDRPINVTLQRALRALSWWQTIKLMCRLMCDDTVSASEVEECKQTDLLEKLMQEMAGEFPTFSEVFVKERDIFLCHSLQMAAVPQLTKNSVLPLRPVNVVGVVGIGHARGIAELWGNVDPHKMIPAIMKIPPVTMSTRIMKYTVKYGLIGLVLLGAFRIVRPRVSHLF